MPVFEDQLGRKISLEKTPTKIISVVPSQTELLYHLGLNEEVIGITKFCIHPKEWFRHKTRVGGTKQLNIEKIISLQPDLVIANKEENVQEQIEMLANEFPVWISDVNNMDDALAMINSIGAIVNKQQQVQNTIEQITNNFNNLEHQTLNIRRKACYLIWREPYMTIGGDTFINDMMQRAGFENMFQNKTRYPEISIDELNKNGCELLLLSSEPFPFQQKHIDELQTILPNTKIILVDGEYFSWYGSRLIHAPNYFMHLQQQLLVND